MCLRFKFCTNQRVCVFDFPKKVKFVVPYWPGYAERLKCGYTTGGGGGEGGGLHEKRARKSRKIAGIADWFGRGGGRW
jgi:hypothetical protein